MTTLETMAELGLPLLIHGEVTDRSIDIFDREAVFLERTLGPLMQRLPTLKVVLEHITTKNSVEFVRAHPKMGATITAHHLLYERNDMLAGGIRPHLYCLPILKRSLHRDALLEAATSGDPQFFLGTDSALMLLVTRNQTVVARDATPHLWPSNYTQKCSRPKIDWTNLRPLPVSMALISMVFREIPRPSR
jgi:dihydroorotase (homodimeric type)